MNTAKGTSQCQSHQNKGTFGTGYNNRLHSDYQRPASYILEKKKKTGQA